MESAFGGGSILIFWGGNLIDYFRFYIYFGFAGGLDDWEVKITDFVVLSWLSRFLLCSGSSRLFVRWELNYEYHKKKSGCVLCCFVAASV